MKVLHIVDSMAARGGGPAYSVPNLVNGLRNAGVAADIFTAIPDGCEVTLSQDVKVLGCKVASMSDLKQWYNALNQTAIDYDLLHLHGCWSLKQLFASRASRKLGKPYCISPRGMLEPWSMAQGKLKKCFAWKLYQKSVFKHASLIHATAISEADNIKELGIKTPSAIVANGVDIPADISEESALQNVESRYPIMAGKRYIVFLSRLHYKKGLERLLAYWNKNRHIWPDTVLAIAGEGQADYVTKLKRLAVETVEAGQVLFTGGVYGQLKNDLLAGAAFFVLPTFSENFGIAIAEALAVETPVITTKGTPWSELIDRKCGWWVDLAGDEFEKTMELALNSTSHELKAMGQRGRKLMVEKYSWSQLAEEMMQAYMRIERK